VELSGLKAMNFSCDYFQLFGFSVSYKIDLALLDKRYHELQFKFHPDRYMAGSLQEQRLAVQYVSLVNQAYAQLKSPLFRAKYLLSLQSISFSDETHIIHDPLFLMDQIELREKLADIREMDQAPIVLEQLKENASLRYTEIQEMFEGQYNKNDFHVAFDSLTKMQFMSKFLDEIRRLEEELDDF
tara:strand:+ start:10964 stop:11518 length:555 start_codon:yes stop_codon:yes gene_type:complete